MNEELELIDLGDAMAETKCMYPQGPYYDFTYGGSWRTC